MAERRKVVLITGATGGIGKATAIALAKNDTYDFALHYNTANSETQHELASSILQASADDQIKIVFFKADMGNFDDVRKMHRDVVEHFGSVDVLFANAGAAGGHSGVQSLADVPIDVFERTWRINTGSPILLTQLCLPHMEEQGWGRVILCSSVAAFTGGYVGPHYASSKSAQHGFVHWLANNIAKKGITVNGVAPAMVGDTNMMGSSENEELKKRVEARLPVGRLGKPEEIAETVVWMVRCGYVTNKVVAVDGGYYPY